MKSTLSAETLALLDGAEAAFYIIQILFEVKKCAVPANPLVLEFFFS